MRSRELWGRRGIGEGVLGSVREELGGRRWVGEVGLGGGR